MKQTRGPHYEQTNILVVFTLTPPLAIALDNSCISEQKTHIYYVNGVWNSYDDARLAARRIDRSYRNNIENQYPDSTFEFTVAYNYSAGKVNDVLEVIGQKINEINDPEVDKLSAADYFHIYMSSRNFFESIPTNAALISTIIEKYLATRITEAITADSHIQKYEENLLGGARVLLIAHSQGNLFANEAVKTLQSEFGDSIGMIGVASPASVTHNNSTYYTAHDDLVINALRLIHTVIASNIDNDPGVFNDNRDISNHQFLPSYFDDGLASRSKIDSDFYKNIANLSYPDKEITEGGAIKVTLKWGAQPDVDLHVYEPQGTHVYYNNFTGTNGFLDLDDVSSYGPEHYFTSCENVEEGVYRIGINYFKRTGSEIAKIQISTADGVTRNFVKLLSAAVGPAGDLSPLNVAKIIVSKDENGVFIYQTSESSTNRAYILTTDPNESSYLGTKI